LKLREGDKDSMADKSSQNEENEKEERWRK
jgi:hypothetical protein